MPKIFWIVLIALWGNPVDAQQPTNVSQHNLFTARYRTVVLSREGGKMELHVNEFLARAGGTEGACHIMWQERIMEKNELKNFGDYQTLVLPENGSAEIPEYPARVACEKVPGTTSSYGPKIYVTGPYYRIVVTPRK